MVVSRPIHSRGKAARRSLCRFVLVCVWEELVPGRMRLRSRRRQMRPMWAMKCSPAPMRGIGCRKTPMRPDAADVFSAVGFEVTAPSEATNEDTTAARAAIADAGVVALLQLTLEPPHVNLTEYLGEAG